MKRTLVASHQQSLFGLSSPAQQLHQGVVHKVICCVDERNEDLQRQGGAGCCVFHALFANPCGSWWPLIIGPKHAETVMLSPKPGKSPRAKVTAPGKAMLKMVRTDWETTGGQTRTVYTHPIQSESSTVSFDELFKFFSGHANHEKWYGQSCAL